MPQVNGVFAVAVLATVALAVRGSAQTAKPPMVGRWRGEGTIVAPWPRQRALVVDLTIFASDSVAGKVGDATLVGGWITTRDPGSRSSLRWNTDYMILGNLDGPIIRAEGIWRPSVQIPLNWNGDGFAGGLTTTGWRVGSLDHRTVDARLVLRRVLVVQMCGTDACGKALAEREVSPTP
jgi:hypothetical protein